MREEWGFDLIEMDLLYAAALFPPKGMSRGEAMDTAMNVLVSAKGGAVYRLNGVPLGSAFGKAEYCRVAADTTPYWEDSFLRNIHCRERASTVNALRSTVGRRHLDGRLLSADTDAFRLRRRRKGMEPGRRYTQILLQSLFGTFLCTADGVSKYDEDEFRVFASLFPKVGAEIEETVESRRTVAVRYRAGERLYFSFSNLSERWRSFVLPEGRWFCAPGMERRAHHVAGGRKIHLKPGESRNYLLLDDGDAFAGSDGHVFPGAEVASVAADGSGGSVWRIIPRPGVVRDFRVWIRAAPSGPVIINGEEAGTMETPFGERLAVGTVLRPQAGQ
jgi:alpha-galactosidase